MKKYNYLKLHPWKIIEEGFHPNKVTSSESLFSIGNGHMGQRANFEESYSGETFRGSYIAGVYYPDRTKVGWWKIGYPDFFAKVLNSPNWIGIELNINNQDFDLNKCLRIEGFKRVLNLKEGFYLRSFEAILKDKTRVFIESKRFLSMARKDIGMIRYKIKPINKKCSIKLKSYIDGDVANQDSNWDEKFWKHEGKETRDNFAALKSKTLKTSYKVCTFMHNELFLNDEIIREKPKIEIKKNKISHTFSYEVETNKSLSIVKCGGYVSSIHHSSVNFNKTYKISKEALDLGFNFLLNEQKNEWKKIWENSDVLINGDVKAQQAIRYNIFQLNQTYTGEDERLNIGPKGFTGEKYGGGTYWDTEAFCFPFYLATKGTFAARNLLRYRYNHLEKAIENSQKLGFSNGAALYPMVTMNGEECHNEWEITFEEIHRNGAIAYAIFYYENFTNDKSYIPKYGLEVLIGISRFWEQRLSFSEEKNKYVLLGVTGPNEYENNVNNNWYTNYIAKWCLNYSVIQVQNVKEKYMTDYRRIKKKTGLNETEIKKWKEIYQNIYMPYDSKKQVYLQQEGFLDKELKSVDEIPINERPINQNWSWDKILRSPYIKQADVLQGFYFFEDDFTREELGKNFEFYEPFTVHESSLSACVHSILASRLDKKEKAYQFFLNASRLDLDDYNKEVMEGLHITSMGGAWMAISKGFGGMKISNGVFSFNPKLPPKWTFLSFKVNFDGSILTVMINKKETTFELTGSKPINLISSGKKITVQPKKHIT